MTVRIQKQADRLHVDFAGTGGPARGPVNAPFPVTASAAYYALLGLAGGDVPPNSGAYSAATIEAPIGCLVHARYPSPVVAANTETSNRLVDLILGALGQAYPERVPAGSYGSACVYTLGGHDALRGRDFVHYETIGGGMGARQAASGESGLRVHMGNTMNLPVEAMEAGLPIRFHAYGIARGTGGKGRRNGGHGTRKVVEMMAGGVQASILGERTATPAQGLAGGAPGACAQFYIRSRSGEIAELPSKSGPHRLEAGDRIEMVTAGGGGWGEWTPTKLEE